MTHEFTCLECGALFDDPQKYIERHGFNTPPYEVISVCPICGGAYTNTIFCDACGEPITGEYVKISQTGDCYCDSCFMLKSLGNN